MWRLCKMRRNERTDPEKAIAFPGTLMLILLLILFPSGSSFAKVSGVCSDCHTMHNSQNDSTMATGGPNSTLLMNSCLGCHTGTNDGSNTIPYVYSTTEPTYGTNTLAGGNFYWVKTDDAKGHNVHSDNPDSLSAAPGAVIGACGSESCHSNLHATNTNYGTRQGCSKCHMMGNSSGPKGYHHKDDTGPVIDTAEEGCSASWQDIWEELDPAFRELRILTGSIPQTQMIITSILAILAPRLPLELSPLWAIP